MKKRTKLILILAGALAATVTVAACSSRKASMEDTIDRYLAQGYDVVIRYERMGGVFGASTDANIVDMFKHEQFEGDGMKLLEPGDAKRKNGSAGSMPSRNGYVLLGWYENCEPRVNEQGEPLDDEGNVCNITRPVMQDVTDADGNPVLDEDGNVKQEPVLDIHGNETFELVSVRGKTQGYQYSDPWDFENDSCVLGEDLVLSPYDDDHPDKQVYMLTLYAAWCPQPYYEFYVEENEEWQVYGTVTLPTGSEYEEKGLNVPKWDEDGSGAVDYATGTGSYVNFAFPEYVIPADPETQTEEQRFTLTDVYGGIEQTNDGYKPIEPYATNHLSTRDTSKETIVHPIKINYETGTATDVACSVYTVWEAGARYRITKAAQLNDNASADGIYEINANLDCSEIDEWKFSDIAFRGTIIGKGHTVSGIHSTQSSADQIYYGGVFGRILADAKIEDISFDVEFTLAAGTYRTTGSYGLLAGTLSFDAHLSDVTISGKLLVGGRDFVDLLGGSIMYGQEVTTYSVGVVSGNCFGENIAARGVTVGDVETTFTEYDGYNEFNELVHGHQTDATWNSDKTSKEYGKVTIRILKFFVEADKEEASASME